ASHLRSLFACRPPNEDILVRAPHRKSPTAWYMNLLGDIHKLCQCWRLFRQGFPPGSVSLPRQYDANVLATPDEIAGLRWNFQRRPTVAPGRVLWSRTEIRLKRCLPSWRM